MKTVLLESFQWAQQIWPILKAFEDDGVAYYRVIASNADIKNRNGRVYTSEELSRAASSLSERPLNINHHDKDQLAFPENQVLIARFEEGRVEAIIQIADSKVQQMIDAGKISTVSIEGYYLDTSKNTSNTEYPTSLHFRALALLTKDDVPGDPLAQIIKESARVSIAGFITEHLLVQEEEWASSQINDLPDDSFAYIEPHGKKDEQGKTTPRSLRHLPYKDAEGKIDPAHVRNALARLPQSNLSAQAKAAAHKKLTAAAKQVGIETGEDALPNSPAQQNTSEPQSKRISGKGSSPSAEDDSITNPDKDHSNDVQQSHQTAQNETRTNTNYVGTGNPEDVIKPRMDYPLDTNPLGITNEPSRKLQDGSIPVRTTLAPDLLTALNNSTTNQAVDRIPVVKESESLTVTKISESEKSNMSQTEQVSKQVEQSQANSQAKESSSNMISVKLEGAAEFKQGMETFAQTLKELAPIPKPVAKLSGTEQTVGQPVEEKAVKEKARLDTIARVLRQMVNVKEDIPSSGATGALGQVWSPDMIVLPPDLPANLRRFVQVKEIPRGSKQINFTTITTAEFASLTEDTASTDVTNTITEISVTPSETGAKQRISYVVMESATPDVVQAVERSFQAAALIDEDNIILSALDGATPAATLYGDESVTQESSITSSMTFKAARLASALREIQKKGYSIGPGDLVAVLHPVQYDSLLKDTAVSQYLYFGSVGPIQQAVIPQVYGVDVVRSTKVPTGTGSGSPAITTYHAQVLMKASAKGDPNGLGVGGTAALGISRDLMIETWRKIDERALYVVASHRVACGVLQPNALAHVYTA